jgi:hypothetical protein
MQCRDAQFYLRLRRHAGDELGADVAAELDRHLAGCGACAAEARAAESFDRAVAAAMRTVPVPAGLREKLLTQASVYRGGVIRRLVYRVAALAACLFLGVGLAFGLFAARPTLDTAALVERNHDLSKYPDVALQRWLADQKLPDSIPLPPQYAGRAFDPMLLVSLGTEPVQGKHVPVAVFANGRAFAKVYVLRSDGPVSTKGVEDAQVSDTSALVLGGEGQYRDVKYVIVYTGHDLNPFLRAQGGPIART